jgi:hypothetical protein
VIPSRHNTAGADRPGPLTPGAGLRSNLPLIVTMSTAARHIGARRAVINVRRSLFALVLRRYD